MEMAGCIAMGEGDGSCLPASIQTIEADQDGDLRFVVPEVLAEEMVFTLNVSSCEVVQPVEFFLNGASLGSFVDPVTDCVCQPEDRQFVADPMTLRSLWKREGNNVITIRKAGEPSPPGQFVGTFVGWIRVLVSGGEDEQRQCLLDVNGGACDRADQCTGGA